jgi:hypothetical protein
MMNCREFQDLVHDLAREASLDAATIETALAHAEVCRACDTLLQEAESLHLGLRSLAARHATEGASAHVEEALLGRLAHRRAPVWHAAGQRVGPRGTWLTSVAGVAAAAALLVSIMVRGDVSQFGNSSEPQIVAAADAAYESDTDFSLEENTADSFISLSPAFDAESLDEGTVVRVVLSDSALESFGLPSSEVGRGQVEADLVVAGDGVPRAIRVVGW